MWRGHHRLSPSTPRVYCPRGSGEFQFPFDGLGVTDCTGAFSDLLTHLAHLLTQKSQSLFEMPASYGYTKVLKAWFRA